MVDYEREFRRLVEYCPGIRDIEEEMRKQFIAGLNPELCTYAVVNEGVTHETT